MLPKLFAVSLLGALFSSSHVNAASSVDAKWIYPSIWYVAEGNWSAFPVMVGTSGYTVDVLVSTTLAETWVIQPQACPSREADQDGFLDCKRLRGGLFNRSTSETWDPLGAWGLGLEYLGIKENGDYGIDTLSMTSIETSLPLPNTAIAALSERDPYIGLIGLGGRPGSFDQKIVHGVIDSATNMSHSVPSRSYGYTAGAYYAFNGTGSPSSLTFGGYDAKRFKPHSQIFYMQGGFPIVNVRGIQASKPSVDSAPTHWNSTTEVLVRVNDSITAIIDTTTPYIWLPSAICDRFASAFNLTWDEQYSIYRLGNTTGESDAQYNLYSNTDLSFTFSLSDVNNNDTFGDPLNQGGVVNITFPMAAFLQPMDFPFAGIKLGESRIPFFPLRRALNDSTLILGRSFMQEAYIVTQYDPDPQFSIHQVVFPNDPLDVLIKTIDGPFGPTEGERKGLSTSQMAGIVFAACAIATIIVVIIVCKRRRKKARQTGERGQTEEIKDGVSDLEADVPKTPVERLFSLITRWKRQKKQQRCEVEGNQRRPAEIAADKDHQRYELPAATEPVELDDGNDRFSVNGTTEFGTDDTRHMTAYEIAQRKIERQLQGPVPAYTPPEDGASMPSDMKSGQDLCLVEHYRPTYNPSIVSSPTAGNHSNLAPSPLSPYPDWPNRALDLPSPMTIAPYPSPHFPNTTSNLSSGSPPVSPNTYNPSSMSRSNSSRSPPRSPDDLHNPSPPSLPSLTEGQPHLPEQNNDPSPTSRTASHSAGSPNSTHFPRSPMDANAVEPPTAAIQRTPIDPSHIVCLGPLPDNVQLPQPHHQSSLASIPRLVGPDGRSIVLPVMQHPEANISVDTLGSNFTEEEEFEGVGQQQVAPPTIPPTAVAVAAAATREARMRQGPPPAINTRISQLRLDARQEEEDLPRSPMRIDSGLDIVHVPQLAERRYSWEDDRT